ncbi:MAG: sigma-70 family RNA polymerase sigma factor [Planctomycetes bacterium]|nr:sigma-70 family RNA polymerase sigma factor [Planctomycetota bacterium]
MDDGDEWKDMPTIDLVREAQSGRGEARDELFQRYSDRVLGIVRARIGPRLRRNVESGDIAQEALIEALQSLDRFETRGESSLIRWLATIVQNRISARAKYFSAERRSSAREIALDGLGPEHDSSIDPPARVRTPSLEVRSQEEQGLVEECLHELPENYRELILMRDYAGSSWEEVAEQVGAASPDAARMMHTRARTQLGRLLQARGMR